MVCNTATHIIVSYVIGLTLLPSVGKICHNTKNICLWDSTLYPDAVITKDVIVISTTFTILRSF